MSETRIAATTAGEAESNWWQPAGETYIQAAGPDHVTVIVEARIDATSDAAEIERLLGDLGFLLKGGPDEWQVTPPSWRRDVTTEACIVEELARLHGFEHIPPVPVRRTAASASRNAGGTTDIGPWELTWRV